MDQRHIVLKDDHTRPYMWSQKEVVSETKHFYWVTLNGIWSFHHYHNDSIREMSRKATNGKLLCMYLKTK